MAISKPLTTTSNSLKAVEWMWKANEDPFSGEKAEWKHYSDVENMIIERAYQNKESQAVLDVYYIDFNDNLQISTEDSYKQRPVERVVRKREDKHLREARFMDLPVSSDRSFGGQYGWMSPFVIEVRRDLNLKMEDLPSKKPQLIPELVEKAAQGIIKEGKHIKKQREAEEMANTLLETQHKSMEDVWKCCAYLYSLESFLYKTLNAAMRLVGSKDDEEIWRSKIKTLGPFCLLLWDDPFNKKVRSNIELYRGANLTPEQINQYKKMTENEEEYGSFQGFSSCSRNRSKAENFSDANVLFIMKVYYAFIADLSELSEYPEEEEELITPGVCFRVERVEFDKNKKKHYIYLKLQQRFNGKKQESMIAFFAHLTFPFDTRKIVGNKQFI